MERPLLWSYVPQAEVLLTTLQPRLVVYHCVDDIAAQKGVHAESFRAAEQRFASRADLVIASAPALAERMRGSTPNVLEAPNVADTDLFAAALQPGEVDPAMDALSRPRVVFHGAIVATKLNVPLLVELARLRPRVELRPRRPHRSRRPGHRRLRARARAQPSSSRRPALRGAARRAARRRRGDHPVRDQPADQQHLSR